MQVVYLFLAILLTSVWWLGAYVAFMWFLGGGTICEKVDSSHRVSIQVSLSKV
jgi:hypothetical protein